MDTARRLAHLGRPFLTSFTPNTPAPPRTAATKPFWNACRQGRFCVTRCGDCGQRHFATDGVCSACRSSRVFWEQASGRGTLYSYVIAHNLPGRGKGEPSPVIAIVQLEEGPQVMADLTGLDDESPRVGMPVQAAFHTTPSGQAAFSFVPAPGQTS